MSGRVNVYNDPLYRKNRAIVLKASNYVCVYCAGVANTADHLIPVSLGGTHELSNLAAACGKCNYGRGNKTRIRMPYGNRKYFSHGIRGE